jgi:hypothetical protein
MNMPENKSYLNDFVQDIFEDNFAKAKDDLQSAIVEKLKNRMKDEMSASEKPSKKEKGA